VNSLPTVTRQRHGCDLNPGPSASESSTLTSRPGKLTEKVTQGNVKRTFIERVINAKASSTMYPSVL